MESMFRSCKKLTSLDLSSFNTSNVTSMNMMFYRCDILSTLDLSSFDTSNVTNMNSMFYNCLVITRIYVSDKWNTDKVTDSTTMFSGCLCLSGGSGTRCIGDKTDKEYARIDKEGQSGFLTGAYTLALPENMEIADDADADKKAGEKSYFSGAEIKIKAAYGYTLTNVSANGTALHANENGIYTVTFGEDNIIVTADGSVILGDVNFDGKVNDADAAMLLKYISAGTPFFADDNAKNKTAIKAANADGIGDVDMLDVIKILEIAD